MREISMLEFRRDARKALALVRRGIPLVLTYRGEPVARLEPIRESGRVVAPDDPLLHPEPYTVDGPGGSLPNEDIDRIVYGG